MMKKRKIFARAAKRGIRWFDVAGEGMKIKLFNILAKVRSDLKKVWHRVYWVNKGRKQNSRGQPPHHSFAVVFVFSTIWSWFPSGVFSQCRRRQQQPMSPTGVCAGIYEPLASGHAIFDYPNDQWCNSIPLS